MEEHARPDEISPAHWAATPFSVRALVHRLLATIEQYEPRLALLEARLNQTWQNSSKSPASDPPEVKPKPAKTPYSKPRKYGAQVGHPPHERPLLPKDQVHRVVPLRSSCCPQCNETLAECLPPLVLPQRQQVWERPQIEPVVTKYQLHTCAALAVVTKHQLHTCAALAMAILLRLNVRQRCPLERLGRRWSRCLRCSTVATASPTASLSRSWRWVRNLRGRAEAKGPWQETAREMERLAILDPEERLLARWETNTAHTGMRFLRSIVIHHLALDPHSLWNYARQRGLAPSQFCGRERQQTAWEWCDAHRALPAPRSAGPVHLPGARGGPARRPGPA